MIRFMLWVTFWVATLCILDIKVEYADGLKIELKGWCTRLSDRLKNRKQPDKG